MNLNTRLHILGHVALKLAALAGALGGLLLITTIMLPPRAAQASSPDPQAAVAAGGYHTCALKGGQVYCWGHNYTGQLGDGTTTQRITPTLVADGAMGNSGVTAVAAGGYHTCALKGGKVYCWGWNGLGQLGDGTTTQRITPTLVADGEMGNSGVTAVAVGWAYTCALKGGKVYCWGWNGYGHLGDGTNTDRNTPTLVADGEMGNSGVTAIAAAEGYHTCALKGGRVYCWGGNDYGQLGDGTNTDRNTPTLVADGEMGNSGVTAVAAGGYHTCALKGGKVYCWGANDEGQLGDNTTTDRNTPTLVEDGAMGNSGVTAVAAGGFHTCALKGGQVYCWGWNGYGHLGDGTTTNRKTPTLVANGAMGNSGVTAVAAGGFHTLGLKLDTCLFAWGWNGNGQLGDGGTSNRTTPGQVSGGCGWGITLPVFIPIVYRP
jgi:alpha-tubulin suppressor-like RCC1 family protein